MARDLDKEHPPGDPRAVFCRWCQGTKRTHRNAVLICGECDLIKPEGVVE